ncbi:TrbI/VirB10 family protein [Acidobacteria bacterium AB60]|nr:TrbI/VirB10 family protein [Acidobacteria bacterium AB60]
MGVSRAAKVGMVLSLVTGATGLPLAVWGQAEGAAGQAPAAQAAGQTADSAVSIAAPAAAVGQQAGQGAGAEKRTYTVPAGTKVLLQLRSAINSKSAKVGDGVYLASTFPVVVGNRVMIPAGVYVQGTVDRVERAGHVKGRAQVDMHFTSIIFPNGSVVEIPGLVNSLPGASNQKVKDDGEGTIEQNGDKTRNMGKVAEVSVPTGGTVGSVAGLGSGHPLAGGIAGIAGGVGAAALVSLFTRGADVNIPEGTQVEMVLQRPLMLEDANLSAGGGTVTAPALVPSAQQPKPLEKPTRARIMCPPGGLGCE